MKKIIVQLAVEVLFVSIAQVAAEAQFFLQESLEKTAELINCASDESHMLSTASASNTHTSQPSVRATAC